MPASELDLRRPGTLWVRNLDWPLPENVAPRMPVTFRRISVNEIDSLTRLMQLDRSAIIQQRLAAGKRCYVAQVEGTLAAYGWVSYLEEDIGEVNLRIHLMPGEAYIWDCATAPAYRQQRLYTGLLMHIATQLQAEGLCRVWIGADGDNIASQRGMASAGFEPVVDLVETRILAMRLFRVRGRLSAPQSVVADARRALLGNHDRAWLAALSLVKVSSTRSSSNVVPGG